MFVLNNMENVVIRRDIHVQTDKGEVKEELNQLFLEGVSRRNAMREQLAALKKEHAAYKSESKKLMALGEWSEADLHFKFKRERTMNFVVDESINSKVSLWMGDITSLEVEAIVTDAGESEGVDAKVLAAGGEGLLQECASVVRRSAVGTTSATKGHNLLCKHVLHSIGPKVKKEASSHPLPLAEIDDCYTSILSLSKELKISSLAIVPISTAEEANIPLKISIHMALTRVRQWLSEEENRDKISRIVFVVDTPTLFNAFEEMMQRYFPTGMKKSIEVVVPPTGLKHPTSKAFSEALSIKSISKLVAAIRASHLPPDDAPHKTDTLDSSKMDLSGLEASLESLDPADQKRFFSNTLPRIINLVSRRKHILSDCGLNLLIQGQDAEVRLSTLEIACLLACAFLTIMPEQLALDQKFAHFSLEGLWKTWKRPKLRRGQQGDVSESAEESSNKKIVNHKQTTNNLVVAALPATHVSANVHPNELARKENAIVKLRALIAFFDADLPERDVERKVSYYRRVTPTSTSSPLDLAKLRSKPAEIQAANVPLSAANPPQVAILPVSETFTSRWFEHKVRMSEMDAYVWSHPEMLVLALLASPLGCNETLQVKNARHLLNVMVTPDKHFAMPPAEEGAPLKSHGVGSRKPHAIFIPQMHTSLPRHEPMPFYWQSQIDIVRRALQTYKNGPLRFSSLSWRSDPSFKGSLELTNLLLAISVSSLDTQLELGEPLPSFGSDDNRPHLTLYQSAIIPSELQNLLRLVDTQEICYDLLVNAATGRPLFEKLSGNGSLLSQLVEHFTKYKREYKVVCKDRETAVK